MFALSAISSLVCAAFLLRAHFRTRSHLLLWSGLCFLAFFIDNILLLGAAGTPLEAPPIASEVPALVGAAVLVFGLIWETRA